MMETDSNNNKMHVKAFEREYFIQTRKEIDSEKQARTRLFHYAVIVFGGLTAFYIDMYKDSLPNFKLDFFCMGLAVSLLFILTTIFYVRHRKLLQIAHRWYVLYIMINKWYGLEEARLFLESIVVNGFDKKHYLTKDLALTFCLAFPIYLFLLGFSIKAETNILCLSISVVIVHIVASSLVLGRKVKPPEDIREQVNRYQKAT